jgi:hypothetical protein
MSFHYDTLSWFRAQQSYFLIMFCACRKSSKYKCNILWFDPTWTQTHDLPHTNYLSLTYMYYVYIYIYIYILRQSIDGNDYLSGAAQGEQTKNL